MGIDINAVGEYDGKPINELPMDSFEDKPWRKPGADITDYFNYGFDELTWSAYCSKQDKLSDLTPQKVMAMLGMNPMDFMMGAGSMMPPPPPPGGFPGAPPGFDMMGMPPMFGGDMPGFPPMGGPPNGGGNNGAYGGSNVQGVPMNMNNNNNNFQRNNNFQQPPPQGPNWRGGGGRR